MEAEQPFKWTFFLETGVERAKVPHTPQSTAYHSIVQLYVCGCWRCGGADPSGSDNAGYVAPGRARFTSPLVPLRFSPPVHALRPMRLASLACYGGVQDKPRQRFVYLSVHLKR